MHLSKIVVCVAYEWPKLWRKCVASGISHYLTYVAQTPPFTAYENQSCFPLAHALIHTLLPWSFHGTATCHAAGMENLTSWRPYERQFPDGSSLCLIPKWAWRWEDKRMGEKQSQTEGRAANGSLNFSLVSNCVRNPLFKCHLVLEISVGNY